MKDHMFFLDIKGEAQSLEAEEVEELHFLSADVVASSKLLSSIKWQKSRNTWLKEGVCNNPFLTRIILFIYYMYLCVFICVYLWFRVKRKGRENREAL